MVVGVQVAPAQPVRDAHPAEDRVRLKRQRPGFNESYHGFRSFNQLLEEARDRKLLELEKDEKSGGYIVRAVAA